MYAVIKTGGKQYRVTEGDTISIERDVLEGATKTGIVKFDALIVGGDEPRVGDPVVKGVTVKGKVVNEVRGPKITVFRKKRRTQYKKKQGHRQDLVEVRIDSIKG